MRVANELERVGTGYSGEDLLDSGVILGEVSLCLEDGIFRWLEVQVVGEAGQRHHFALIFLEPERIHVAVSQVLPATLEPRFALILQLVYVSKLHLDHICNVLFAFFSENERHAEFQEV